MSTSREQSVRQLLSHEEMGELKPSQFLRHLKNLTPDILDEFLRTIWASRLPPHVQAILAGQTVGSLDSASHLANRTCEVTPLPNTGSVTPSTPDKTAGVLERIEELSRQVASLQVSQTQSPACQSDNARTPEIPHQHHQKPSAAPRHLLVPLAVRERSPKMHPTVLPPAEGLAPS